MDKKGKIKISSENMMPIIKKWLYSDKDIFLREIVANGIDAITKYKKLVDMGEAEKDEKLRESGILKPMEAAGIIPQRAERHRQM